MIFLMVGAESQPQARMHRWDPHDAFISGRSGIFSLFRRFDGTNDALIVPC